MKRGFMDYARSFVGGLVLGALTALPACAIGGNGYKKVDEHVSAERIIGAKDIGESWTYVGFGSECVRNREEALEAVRKDTDSGCIFVGFSEADIGHAKRALDWYNRVNQKVLGSLEPVFIKVEGYKTTEEDKRRFIETNQKLQEMAERDPADSFKDMIEVNDLLEQYQKLESRINPFLATAYPNIVNLDKCLAHLNHGVEDFPLLESDSDNWKGFWYSCADFQKWENGELDAETLAANMLPAFPDGYDVVFWVGDFQDGKHPDEVVAHELGHLVEAENRWELSTAIERFGELNEAGTSRLSDYSQFKGEIKSHIVDPVATWFSDSIHEIVLYFQGERDAVKNSVQAYKAMLRMNDEHLTFIEKHPNDGEAIERLAELKRNLEEDISRQEQDASRFEALANKIMWIPQREDIRTALEQSNRQRRVFNLAQLHAEDIAEAFMYAVSGKVASDDVGKEKVRIVLDFMSGYGENE